MGKNRINTAAKVLFARYVLTGTALVILAALLYKFDLSEQVVNLSILAIYILTGFFGGFLAGKLQKVRKFLWGALLGAVYFLILFIVSLLLNHGFGNDAVHFLTTMVLCVASATVGGMVS